MYNFSVFILCEYEWLYVWQTMKNDPSGDQPYATRMCADETWKLVTSTQHNMGLQTQQQITAAGGLGCTAAAGTAAPQQADQGANLHCLPRQTDANNNNIIFIIGFKCTDTNTSENQNV